MERLNPKTGNPWQYGEVAADGRIFLAYRRKSRINKDGTFQINWLTPEAWERRKEFYKTSIKQQYAKNSQIIRETKLKQGCQCCGYKTHACALDFDHLNPTTKVRGIAQLCTANTSKLLQEIKKCQVLCANCHRIKTHDPEAFKQLMEKASLSSGSAMD